MIYQLYCALIMAGYSAGGLLLGSYMMYYAGAHEIDLGYLFMIQPMTIFLRPIICAQADRYQSHKQLLSCFALIASFAYVPFILMPFVCGSKELPMEETIELAIAPHEQTGVCSDLRLRFWILACSHLVGSIGFCGVRSLGDALAVNFAKRIGSAFSSYRKYGAISFGLCGYLLGHINQGWLLPDFVPSFIVYSSSLFVLAVLVYLWPEQYFEMRAKVSDQEVADAADMAEKLSGQWSDDHIPEGREIVVHMARKIGSCFGCCNAHDADDTMTAEAKKQRQIKLEERNQRYLQVQASKQDNDNYSICSRQTTNQQRASNATSINGYDTNGDLVEVPIKSKQKSLTIVQQLSIFLLLIKRDFRIPLYLLTILYGGLVGYAGPNFVFTYMNKVCHEKGTCDAAKLAGLTMISYCTVETLCYIIITKFCSRPNRVFMLEITFVSLIVHYYFYGFVLDSVSPYFFLVESLHGVEYSISLATSIDLGYDFGSEVELLIPELVSKGIIGPDDDHNLVKVALMATMSGCCTLVYDGFGCILGSFIFGQITGHYSFNTTWLVIGTLSSIGFLVVLIVYLIGRCFNIKPQISQLKYAKRQQIQTHSSSA